MLIHSSPPSTWAGVGARAPIRNASWSRGPSQAREALLCKAAGGAAGLGEEMNAICSRRVLGSDLHEQERVGPTPAGAGAAAHRGAPGTARPAHLNEARAVPESGQRQSPTNPRPQESGMPGAEGGSGAELLGCRRPAAGRGRAAREGRGPASRRPNAPRNPDSDWGKRGPSGSSRGVLGPADLGPDPSAVLNGAVLDTLRR